MKRLMLLWAMTWLVACGYDPDFRDCVIRCAAAPDHPTTDERCPDGMTCGDQNLCRTGETIAACGAVAACMNPGDPIVDLAVFKPTAADAFYGSGGESSNANDNNDATRWTAAGDGNPGHWWQVDLGSDRLLESINTLWEMDGVNYKYFISISSDGANFATVIDQTSDTRTARARMDAFPAGTCTRYVRVTKTDTSGWWAILYTVKVMGR